MTIIKIVRIGTVRLVGGQVFPTISDNNQSGAPQTRIGFLFVSWYFYLNLRFTEKMKPKIFIGSSVEGKPIAEALNTLLEHDVRGRLWPNTFIGSSITIDSLIKESAENDFAIFVFSPDDLIKMRDKTFYGARDNVIFESGLFLGNMGREQVFIVIPRDLPDYHVLTDLSGVTFVNYDPLRIKKEFDVEPALQSAATQIKKAIKNSGWHNHRLEITTKASAEPTHNWKLKAHFYFKNSHHYPMLIESLDFEWNNFLRLDPISGSDYYRTPKFLFAKDQIHAYKSQVIIEPDQKVLSCWIPVDPTIGINKLEKAVLDRQVGIWKYRCTFLKERIESFSYEDAV